MSLQKRKKLAVKNARDLARAYTSVRIRVRTTVRVRARVRARVTVRV